MSVFLFTRMLVAIFACTFIWYEAGWVTACFAFVLYIWNEANSDAFEKAEEAIRNTDERLEQVEGRR